MRYTVTSTDMADAALARFFNNAPDPTAVSAASNRIDQLLRTTPEQCGVPFLGIFRRLTVAPLEVLYHVSPDDCLVRIYSYRLVS
jgi:hypothetical protein